MLHLNDDNNDELFRKAAGSYPLRTDNSDWKAVIDKMNVVVSPPRYKTETKEKIIIHHSKALQGICSPLDNPYNSLLKRSFDIFLSIIFIVGFLSWIVPLFALLIKLDSAGPVFFRQKRNGKAGKLFNCIKFRTMHVNEEADLVMARVNDNRITKFGRFLRHHHLDELPQLFNVLMGDMSAIGPRPYMVKENFYYEDLLQDYFYRNYISPGITGLAQSFGYFGSMHEPQKAKERLDLDILYIRNW